jgi:hypothetical protein
MDDTTESRSWRRWAPKVAIAAGGLLVGGLLAGTLTASAADTTASTAGQSATQGPRAGGNVDESKSQRPDEELLSGDTATKSARPLWPGTRARPCSGWRPTPTGSTKPTCRPPTGAASPSRSTRPSR